MKLRSSVLIPFAAALAFAAPAQADDASVFAAYKGHAQEMKQAADAYRAAMKPLTKHHGWRDESEAQAVIDADTLIDNVLDAIAAEVKAQPASTEIGTKAQKFSLREIALWRKANVYEQQCFAEAIAGHPKRSDRLWDKSEQTYKRYIRAQHQAKVAWKKAGFKPGKYGAGH